MTVGVLLLDDRRVFVSANDEAAEYLGTTSDDLLGRRADEFMPVVARALYPLAWQGFLIRGSAQGEYGAKGADDSLRHLAYVGFANRPVRGLHLFVIEPLQGALDDDALVPRRRGDYLQVGLELSEASRERLIKEAEREEWRLPVSKGAERAVFAGLFRTPDAALEVLQAIRSTGPLEASIASAAGSTRSLPLTLLAGRVPSANAGIVLAAIRAGGGQIMAHVDERRTR